MEDLKDMLADMSQFISLEVGDQFTGVYAGAKRVPNKFDSEKESIELAFTVDGSEKTMTSMSLPRYLVQAGVKIGDTVTVKKVSKKGNTIDWGVTKSKASTAEQVQDDERTTTVKEAEAALG